MHGLEQTNRHPVNQHARALLEKAKVVPDPTQVFSSQLMMWALEKGDHGMTPEAAAELRELLEQVDAREPAALMPLMKLEGDWQAIDPEDFRGHDQPEDAARELLAALYREAEALTESEV